jgi:hypothetical protein
LSSLKEVSISASRVVLVTTTEQVTLPPLAGTGVGLASF